MKNIAKLKGTAFTLIELLVVVCIIAILLALSVAAGSRVLETAKEAKCISQMQAIYPAFQAYMQDNNLKFPQGQSPPPPSIPYPGWNGYWYAATPNPNPGIAQYFSGGAQQLLKLVVCPNNTANPDSVPAVTYDPYGYPYVCNYEIMPQNGAVRAPASILSIQAPRIILLTDSGTGAAWKGPGITAASYGTAGWNVANRHLSHLNVLWADGHGTTQTKDSIVATNLLNQP